jgi:hypothetical protein
MEIYLVEAFSKKKYWEKMKNLIPLFVFLLFTLAFKSQNGDKPESAPGGNWLSYITSFHKTILYLNYFLNKLL